ncbi:unnamed protein product [Mucor hiemalis]
MSKHVLQEEEVKNLITTQLTGQNSHYHPRPTEWLNGKKPDVLYTTDDSNASPPILVEVQNIADDVFLHRIVRYCGKVYEEYGTMPIVLVIASNKIRDTILRKATKDTTHPFLHKIPCFPWAKKCFFISPESIRNHLTTVPLSPLVALGIYFSSEAPSVAEHSHGQDPTVQMLYNVSQRVLEAAAIKENTIKDDILSLCQETESKIKEGIEAINESSEDDTNKRALDCLNEGLQIVKSYRRKYNPSEVTPVSSPILAPVSAPAPTLSSTKWQSVINYIARMEGEKMNWNACYEECKSQPALSKYTKSSSLKSAFLRWRKQQTQQI